MLDRAGGSLWRCAKPWAAAVILRCAKNRCRVPQQGLGLTFHPGLFDGEHSL